MKKAQLHITRTPRQMLEVMAEALAQHRDPWARHWLVLSSEGAADWVRQDWAQRSGIASRSQVMNLRTLLESPLVGTQKGGFSLERLTLAIAAHLCPKGIDEKALTHAKTLAEALDVTLLARSSLNNSIEWSSVLLPLVKSPAIADILEHHIARVKDYEAHCKNWIKGWADKGGFPKCWLGINAGLPRCLWNRLDSFINCCPRGAIELFLLDPAEVYWGDLSVKRKNINPHEQPGPLLKFFGQRLQDLHNQVTEHLTAEGDGGSEYEYPEISDKLLGRIQSCCRRVELSIIASHQESDHSFEVHSARNPLRELEVVRDRILQAMDEDPTLKPEEISVLLVDPNTYSPLVMAAFQPVENQRHWLPFSLAADCRPGTSPFKDSLTRLLRIVLGRIQKNELMEVLEDPLVASNFEFAGDEAKAYEAILDGYFSWGADAEHRQQEQGVFDERWSLNFAMQRLALGALCSAEGRAQMLPMGDKAKGSVRVPLQRFSGLETATLAGLANFVKQLQHSHQQWNEKKLRSIAEWNSFVEDLVEQFLTNNPASALIEAELLSEALAYLKVQVEGQVLLTARAYLKLLEPLLQNFAKHQVSSGGIRFGSLQRDAGVPAKMLVVVGLSADVFPRREDRPQWHPLAGSVHIGDPNRREDDRHSLLLALMGTSERLILTYLGGSDTDDRELPPSTPLTDLIDVARQCCKLSIRDTTPFLFRHGLNGFSPQSHTQGGHRSHMSYSELDRKAHEALMQRSPQSMSGLWATPYLGACSTLVHRKQLDTLLREAPKLFLAQLNIVLPEEEDEIEEGDRLTSNGLDQYLWKQSLLDCRILGQSESELYRRWEASGCLPPHKIGKTVFNELLEKVPTVDATLSYRALRPRGQKINFAPYGCELELELGLREPWYIDDQGEVHHFSLKTLSDKKGKFLLGVNHIVLMLDFLCLVGEFKYRSAWIHSSDQVQKIQLAPNCLEQQISQTLMALVKLCQLAKKCPLPHWKSSYDGMVKKWSSSEEQPNNEQLGSLFQQCFEDENGSSSSPSSLSPTRLIFRGCPDVVSWSGPKGLSLAPLSLLPESSLAVGVFKFIKNWEADTMELINHE